MMKQLEVHGQRFEMYSWDGGKSWSSTGESGNKATVAFRRRKEAALNFKFSEKELRWIDTVDEGKKFPGRGSTDEKSALAGHKERFLKRVGLAERKKVQQARQAASALAELPVTDSRPKVLWSEQELCWKQPATPERKLAAWVLYVNHGMTVCEIAERMGAHQTTVGRWIARVKRGDLKERRFSDMQVKVVTTGVRLTKEDRRLFHAAARAEGVGFGEFLRMAAGERAKKILQPNHEKNVPVTE